MYDTCFLQFQTFFHQSEDSEVENARPSNDGASNSRAQHPEQRQPFATMPSTSPPPPSNPRKRGIAEQLAPKAAKRAKLVFSPIVHNESKLKDNRSTNFAPTTAPTRHCRHFS